MHNLTPAETQLYHEASEVADSLLEEFREADAAGGYSPSWHKIRSVLHDEGYLSMYFPTSLGGGGSSILDLVLVQEAFGRHDGGFANIVSHEACASTMLNFAEADVAETLRARMLEGALSAICITEPGVGTDLANMSARAEKQSDGTYRLHGHKRIISLGAVADILMFYAMTDPEAGIRGGISVFAVDAKAAGVSVGETCQMMGYRLLPHNDVILQDVIVPASARLGAEGQGLQIFAEGLNLGRLGGGSQALGLTVGAFERAVRFARSRETMGRPIIKHQAIAFKIAQMEVDIEAMRALTYATARWLDSTSNRASVEAARRVAVVKMHNTDLALRDTSEAVQVFGAQGLWPENDVERLFRDAKASQLVDGPNELMRMRIAAAIAKGESGVLAKEMADV